MKYFSFKAVESLVDADDRNKLYRRASLNSFNVESESLSDTLLVNYVFLLACSVGDLGMLESYWGASKLMPKIRVIAQLFIMRQRTVQSWNYWFPCFKGLKVSRKLFYTPFKWNRLSPWCQFRNCRKVDPARCQSKMGKKIEMWCFTTWRNSLQGEKFWDVINFFENGLDIWKDLWQRKADCFLILAEYSDKLELIERIDRPCAIVGSWWFGQKCFAFALFRLPISRLLGISCSLGIRWSILSTMKDIRFIVLWNHWIGSCCNRWEVFREYY